MINNSYMTHPGCDLKPGPLAQYEQKIKGWDSYKEEPEYHFFQWATQYRNSLRQRGVQPVDVTSRLREITDRMGYLVAKVFRTHEPQEETIETPIGKIQIKAKFSQAKDDCPFEKADPKNRTNNCTWITNRNLTLLNETNGKALSLTMQQLHCLAYHECPVPPHEGFHPNQIYDFVFAPPLKESDPGFDPNATWGENK